MVNHAGQRETGAVIVGCAQPGEVMPDAFVDLADFLLCPICPSRASDTPERRRLMAR